MYRIDIFTDKLEYVSFAMIDSNQSLEFDYLAYDACTIKSKLIDCKKGYYARITKDNSIVYDGVVSDYKPDKKDCEISIKPLNSIFDEEVFYTAVSDAITWLSTNITSTYISTSDTSQRKPLNVTATTGSDSYPLTAFNLHPTLNILSVMISALKTYGVVVESSLNLVTKKIDVNIYHSTNTKRIRADYDNVIDVSITLGDSYGSKNKAEIRKYTVVDDEKVYPSNSVYSFYLHTDGTINSTNNNRLVPVFRVLEELQKYDDQTDSEWSAAALRRATELLEPSKYDNEIILTYDIDDRLIFPMNIKIGTEVIIYHEGKEYTSILTGKRIKNQKIELIFGAIRTELTKQLAIDNR